MKEMFYIKCYCQGIDADLVFCHITQLGKRMFYLVIAFETDYDLNMNSLWCRC